MKQMALQLCWGKINFKDSKGNNLEKDDVIVVHETAYSLM